MGTIKIEIPLIKKSGACCECKYYGTHRGRNAEKTKWCSKYGKLLTMEVALGCRPKKSWKIK